MVHYSTKRTYEKWIKCKEKKKESKKMDIKY